MDIPEFWGVIVVVCGLLRIFLDCFDRPNS